MNNDKGKMNIEAKKMIELLLKHRMNKWLKIYTSTESTPFRANCSR